MVATKSRSKKSSSDQPGKAAPPAVERRQTGPKVAFNDPIVSVPVDLLDRHPDNRVPSAAAIAERARSLQEHGQLEPIVIRLVDDGGPESRYQIVSGETRWQAAQLLEWPTIRARVIECTDAQALELLARFNGERRDLDPIERAKLIQCLCRPIADGGAGYTRNEAAQAVGLESASGASNLVRLLELPEVWQQRVASGALPESFARCLLKVVSVPAALASLDEAWQEHEDATNDWADPFNSRGDVERSVDSEWEEHTRCLDPTSKDKHHYSGKEIGNPGAYGDSYACMIPADVLAAQREALQVITVDGVEYATNAELYDELNIAAIKTKLQKKKQSKVAAAGKQADKKVDPKERAQQLQRQIHQWRNRLLRKSIGTTVAKISSPTDPVVGRLLLHFLANRGLIHHSAEWHDDAMAQEVLYYLLTGYAYGEHFACSIDGESLQEWFNDLQLDLEVEWRKLQSAQQTEDEPFLLEFYSLHRKDELITLGKELELHLPESDSKSAMVAKLAASSRPLPACLELAKSKVVPPRKRKGK